MTAATQHGEGGGSPRSRAFRRPKGLAGAAFAVWTAASPLAGCTVWRPAADPARAIGPGTGVPRARLVLRDSTRLTLDRPVVRDDSIVGDRYQQGATRTAVPLDSVVRVERSVYSGRRTLGLAAAVGVAAATAYVVLLSIALRPRS